MGALETPTSAQNGSNPRPRDGDGEEQQPSSVEMPPPPPPPALYDLIGIHASKRGKTSMLPVDVGTRVLCRWRDGKFHPVKVIERRRIHAAGPHDYEYYVHYTECKDP